MFFYLIWKNRRAIGKKGGYFPLGIGPKFSPAGMADKALVLNNFKTSSVLLENKIYGACLVI